MENEVSPHPLKTFTNLTSGTFQEGDKIVIANPTFFEKIDPGELRVIVSQNHSTQAAIETAKIFKSMGIKNANAIFIEVTTKEDLANLPPEQKIETIYINEQLVSLTANLKNIWRNLLVPLAIAIGSLSKKALTKIKDTVSPKIKVQSKQTFNKLKKITDSAYQAAKIQQIYQQAPKILKDSIGQKSKISNLTKLYSIKSKNKLKRFLYRIGFSKPYGPRIYLYALLITVTILAIAISFSQMKKKQTVEQ